MKRKMEILLIALSCIVHSKHLWVSLDAIKYFSRNTKCSVKWGVSGRLVSIQLKYPVICLLNVLRKNCMYSISQEEECRRNKVVLSYS